MTCTSGLSASVARINCEKGAKSSTTRTPMDVMSAGCSLNVDPTTGSSTRYKPKQQPVTYRHIANQNFHFRHNCQNQAITLIVPQLAPVGRLRVMGFCNNSRCSRFLGRHETSRPPELSSQR